MTEISCQRSLLLQFLSLFLQFIYGISDDSNAQKDTKAEAHGSSRQKNGSKLLIICIALAAVIGLLSFLFKLWQKKKRDEQYSRLLKLFQEDDELELELELGLHD